MQANEQYPLIYWNRPGDSAEQDCACANDDLNPDVRWAPLLDFAEDDCACASPAVSIKKNGGVRPAPWVRASKLFRTNLAPGYELVYNPTGRAGAVLLNWAAGQVLDGFAVPGSVGSVAPSIPHLPEDQVARAAQQLLSLDLLTSVRARIAPVSTSAHTLTAWLHVADACNLGCSYCYVNKTGELMDEATGRAAIDAIFRTAVEHNYAAVKLKYAGGEPLLNLSLVKNLHTYAHRLAAERNLDLREVILSNGLNLDESTLTWIRDSGMRLMVSLDTVGGQGDLRLLPDGRSSAAAVVPMIDLALANQVRPYLSITVTANTADSLDGMVRFALERKLLFNLNFYRACGRNDDGFTAETQQLIAALRGALAVIEERLPEYSLIGALVDRASFGVPHSYPCGAGRNYLVVDQRGRISRCQMQMDRPVSDVWADDPLLHVRTSQEGVFNRPVEQKSTCANCEWQTWCAGGCPLLSQPAGGKSPYCEVYKAILPAALRLEGLRLLRWVRPQI